MGWGVLSPQPSQPRMAPPNTLQCTGRNCGEDVSSEDNVGECNHTGCHCDVLCFGCAYDCRDCGNVFCVAHITLRKGTYLCAHCRGLKERAA